MQHIEFEHKKDVVFFRGGGACYLNSVCRDEYINLINEAMRKGTSGATISDLAIVDFASKTEYDTLCVTDQVYCKHKYLASLHGLEWGVGLAARSSHGGGSQQMYGTI